MHTGKKPASLYLSTATSRDTLYPDNGGISGTGYLPWGVLPATQRSIRRIRVGRFSASPALCATVFAATSPRQRISMINCCNYRRNWVGVKRNFSIFNKSNICTVRSDYGLMTQPSRKTDGCVISLKLVRQKPLDHSGLFFSSEDHIRVHLLCEDVPPLLLS